MTKSDLLLRANVAERASVSWRFERGCKRWHDAVVVLVALLAAGVVAAALGGLRGVDVGLAAYLGLIGAVASQIVWISAGQLRSRKHLAGLSASALQRVPVPVPVSVGQDGVTFAAVRFARSDFRDVQRADGMTLLAASDFDGPVIRDQDLPGDLMPDQLQALLVQRKSP